VLTTAAAAIDAVAPIAGADDPQQARSQVHALLADLDEQQQLKQHGVLLSSIDRLTLQPQIVVGGAFVLVGACSGLARSSPVRPVCGVLCDSGQGPEDPVE
jgi:hypothetical protein